MTSALAFKNGFRMVWQRQAIACAPTCYSGALFRRPVEQLVAVAGAVERVGVPAHTRREYQQQKLFQIFCNIAGV